MIYYSLLGSPIYVRGNLRVQKDGMVYYSTLNILPEWAKSVIFMEAA